MELEDRDPGSLSKHLQVSWEDVIGEPNAIRSPECSWVLSHHCFRLSKNFCYTCLAVVCAPITALCLGFTFACLAFEHIWCITPCLRIWKISCAAIRTFIAAAAAAFVIPCATALGYFWSEIRTRKLSEDYEKSEDVLLV